MPENMLQSLEDVLELDFLDGNTSGYYGDKDNMIDTFVDIEDERNVQVCFEKSDVDGLVECMLEDFPNIKVMSEKEIHDALWDMIESGELCESYRVEVAMTEKDFPMSMERFYKIMDYYAMEQSDILINDERDAFEGVMDALGRDF